MRCHPQKYHCKLSKCNSISNNLIENLIFSYLEEMDINNVLNNTKLYRNKEDRLDINSNELPESNNILPYSIEDIMANDYETSDSLRQASLDIAECNFRVTTEMSSNFVAGTVPWLKMPNLGYRRVLPVHYSVNIPNTPVGFPLFKPTRTNRSGFLSFTYTGDKPIYTTLKGSCEFLLRTSATHLDGDVRVMFNLNAINPPKSEIGQTGGKKALGFSLSTFKEAKPLDNLNNFNDNLFPITNSVINYTKSSDFINLYNGSDVGYIATSTTYPSDENGLKTEDQLGPVNENVRTTKWMDLTDENGEPLSSDTSLFVMVFDGISKRSRIELKNTEGVISYSSALSFNGSSFRLYRIPEDTVAVRIYYSGRDDTVDESTIKFGLLPSSYRDGFDPLAGKWTERRMSINRTVVFYPDVEYFFDLTCFVEGDASIREWGFRFNSFDLSFLFDAGFIREDFSKKNWSK